MLSRGSGGREWETEHGGGGGGARAPPGLRFAGPAGKGARCTASVTVLLDGRHPVSLWHMQRCPLGSLCLSSPTPPSRDRAVCGHWLGSCLLTGCGLWWAWLGWEAQPGGGRLFRDGGTRGLGWALSLTWGLGTLEVSLGEVSPRRFPCPLSSPAAAEGGYGAQTRPSAGGAFSLPATQSPEGAEAAGCAQGRGHSEGQRELKELRNWGFRPRANGRCWGLPVVLVAEAPGSRWAPDPWN